MKGKHMSMGKAKMILHDKEVRGHKLTRKQVAFFGARASGMPMKEMKVKMHKGSPTMHVDEPKGMPMHPDQYCKFAK